MSHSFSNTFLLLLLKLLLVLHLVFDLVSVSGQSHGDTMTLTCTVRDIGFGGPGTNEGGTKEGPHHPDFGTMNQVDKTIVKNTLGADEKPVYNGNPTTPASSGFDNFNLWFNTDTRVTGDGQCGTTFLGSQRVIANEECPRNLESLHDIVLTYVVHCSHCTTNRGTFQFDSSAFFIMDKKGFQPTTTTNAHNWHFTVECSMQFTYVAGNSFQFKGDDDVWVFINKKLAINLGGTHGPLHGSVDLDNKATELGIIPGNSYSMHLFYAERHATGSSMKMTTNIKLVTCPGFWNDWGTCNTTIDKQTRSFVPDAGTLMPTVFCTVYCSFSN
jgi:fibro-slime domain-containing protein